MFLNINCNLFAKEVRPFSKKAKPNDAKKSELDPNKLVSKLGSAPQACTINALAPESPQEKIHKHWLTFLKNGHNTKEHLKFLQDNKVEIKIVRSLPSSSIASFYALYEDGNVYISQDMIDVVSSAIKKQNWGYSEDRHLEVIAQKTIDLIVHEIRHAMTAKELDDLLKTKFPLPLEEDEILSYHDQSKAIADFQDPFFLTDVRTEVLDDMQKQLYNTYIENSQDGIKSYIRQWNPVNSALSKPEDLLKWISSNQKMITNGLGMLQQRLKEIRNTPINDRSSDLAKEEVSLVNTETDYVRNLETLGMARSVIGDSEKFAILQTFYRSKINERFKK